MKNKCDCYHESKKIIFWPPDEAPMTINIGSCWGTRERDECSCGGNRRKCDFYPEVRKKAEERLFSAINVISKETWEEFEEILYKYGFSTTATYDGDDKNVQINFVIENYRKED